MLDPSRRQRARLDRCTAIETMVCLLYTLFLFSIRYAALEFIPM